MFNWIIWETEDSIFRINKDKENKKKLLILETLYFNKFMRTHNNKCKISNKKIYNKIYNKIYKKIYKKIFNKI